MGNCGSKRRRYRIEKKESRAKRQRKEGLGSKNIKPFLRQGIGGASAEGVNRYPQLGEGEKGHSREGQDRSSVAKAATMTEGTVREKGVGATMPDLFNGNVQGGFKGGGTGKGGGENQLVEVRTFGKSRFGGEGG